MKKYLRIMIFLLLIILINGCNKESTEQTIKINFTMRFSYDNEVVAITKFDGDKEYHYATLDGGEEYYLFKEKSTFNKYTKVKGNWVKTTYEEEKTVNKNSYKEIGSSGLNDEYFIVRNGKYELKPEYIDVLFPDLNIVGVEIEVDDENFTLYLQVIIDGFVNSLKVEYFDFNTTVVTLPE